MPEISPPDASTPIVDENGVMTDSFQRWVSEMTDLDLIVGNGSPEGSIEAVVGVEYLDQAGPPGAVKYIKQVPDIGGDRKQGWVVI